LFAGYQFELKLEGEGRGISNELREALALLMHE
jgi:hypothetical protein